jgi:uncharacterized protein (DUF433 family)
MIVVTPGFFGIQACIDGVKIAVQAGLRRATGTSTLDTG